MPSPPNKKDDNKISTIEQTSPFSFFHFSLKLDKLDMQFAV